MRSSNPLLIIALITLASCTSNPTAAQTTALGSGGGPMCLVERPGPEPTWFAGCPVWLCGNTARIYGSPIEALDERGKESQGFTQPFKLLRGRLTNAKGGCAGVANLSLGVRDGGFVGLAGPLDGVMCSGADLLGARFEVQQLLLPTRKTRFATLRIDEVKDVEVWKRDPQDRERVPTYDLVVERGAEMQPEEHLCSPGVWDSAVNLPFDQTTRTRHALLLEGESYSSAGTVLHDNSNGARWFNIGCAGTGIAKLRLLGFDPIRKPEAKGERQSTLKMITAKYCGSKSWTREGTVLLFVQQNSSSSGLPLPSIRDGGGPSIGPIETRWGPDGALCISHSRLWSIGSKCAKESESAFVEFVRNECHIPACDETKPCESAAAASDGVWRTCTVNHILHGL